MPSNGKVTSKVTMQEIAARANVSVSTVSRVLHGGAKVHGSKRHAVLQAAEELNYRPNVLAQSLASGKTRTVGILTQFVSSPIYNAILHAILDELSGSGYSPLYADGYWQSTREQKALQLFLDRQVDGLIVLGGATPDTVLEQLAKQVPLIVVGRMVPTLANQSIRINNLDGGYRATQYLIELGHREIAHIAGISDREDAQLRQQGYEKALREAGLPVHEELIITGNYIEQSGVLAVEMLLNQRRTFTAIFAGNDQMAYGARLALSRRGVRVPDDVSLIGFDDQPQSAYTIPPLTTIRQPAAEMGQLAAQALLHLIRGEPCMVSVFPTELVLRESVARPF